MLRELSVQNLALIEDARVELRGGYCAWTGETGAGKSLLLTALGLVLGGKASLELVRSGKEEARAAAVFDLSADAELREEVEAILGGPIDDDQLILTRRIGSNGRSVAHANGLPVPVATLRRLAPRLIDVHGQHETRTLLDPDRQRALLDAYGGLEAVVASYREARAAHDSLRRTRLALIEAAERRRRERDLLAFERDELSAADPKPGEYEELSREAKRLAGSEAIREAAAEGYALLYDAERSAQALLGKVSRRLEPLADAVPELGAASATLSRLADEAREIAYTLRDLAEETGDDPKRLDRLESRLALYRKLSQRFRCEPDGLAARLEEVEDQLAAIERDDADLQQLDAPLSQAWEALKVAARELSDARRRTCKAFARAVQAHLKDLNLGDARLAVQLEPEPMGDDPTACPPPESGADRIEILFAPNPGEPIRPLRKIASGGELSRLTLAIKTVLAGVDRVPTLVFDEIDTGVGGRLGAVLGKKLAALAEHHQVICVTHLPQMASFASHQWVIRKRTSKGRTRTTIEELVADDRVDELAAMLRGDSAAESTRQEAIAMLSEAQAAGAR
ncbi:DNA repair protein RecN [Tautonia sociabilis]|uniref:DNA repair protein RecN n=1 Tax=Tautonia sociabilis TaxID=2080755 RepID=A0A432MKU0_9BACT|nr:DNA repair protein RecN [Tautonia sociabilis]RUL87698.1 DNA repair protein RecN [Tautonia sociabilis]